jgi:hypothetical protein
LPVENDTGILRYYDIQIQLSNDRWPDHIAASADGEVWSLILSIYYPSIG